MRHEEGVSFIIIFWVKIVGTLKKKREIVVVHRFRANTTKWGLSTYHITDVGGKKRNRFLFLYSNQGNPVLRYSPSSPYLMGRWHIAHPRSLWSRLKHFDVRTVSTRAIAKLFLEIVHFFFFSDVLPDLPQNPVLLQIPADVVNHDFTCPAFTGKSTKNRTGLND